MISYIKGLITFKTPAYVLVETGGIGYQLHISLNTYAQIEHSEKVMLLTHFHVKEDSQTLYGFAKEDERSLFRHLISVSGIGPNTARIILSSLQPEDVRAAIIGSNVALFKKVKGVGPKTAQRIIIDLQDKLMKDGGGTGTMLSVEDNRVREEALSALLALGFSRIPVQKALNKILKEEPGISPVEKLIKRALKELS